MTQKSKEDILQTTFPEKGNYITEAGQKKMRECMDEYAEQEAIAFAEWLSDSGIWWSKTFKKWTGSKTYTTIELYQLFKTQTP